MRDVPEHSALLHSSRLFASPLIELHDVGCRAPRSGYRSVEHASGPALVLVRRGVFTVQRRGETRCVDPGCMLVLRDGDEYRVRHPTRDGDHSTVLALAPSLAEEAIGRTGADDTRLGARAQLVMRGLVECLRMGDADALAVEDVALRWLHVVCAGLDDRRPTSVIGAYQRLRVQRARELLATEPGRSWTLRTLGVALGCSPFHLARQFQAVTGDTISRYLLRLRLSAALEALGEGERDLARLATDLGFAHQSHFGARFRATFDLTPRRARELLSGSDVACLRTALDPVALSARS